jgi:hypothetical protein
MACLKLSSPERQSFGLLTEALATITGESVEDLRYEYNCQNASNPEASEPECNFDEVDDEGLPSAARTRLLALLDLWPQHRGINYSAYDDELLIDLVRQSIERERAVTV